MSSAEAAGMEEERAAEAALSVYLRRSL